MALRRAIGAVKDQTTISLARVNNYSDTLSELEIAIVKATRHDELPPEERHMREILSLTLYSRQFVSACVGTIARRLNKTHKWVVALKSLMLIQHLLQAGEPAFEEEVFFATRRGTRILNLSDFRDTSGRSNAWDYSAFVRTFALYLDERLEYRMQGRRRSNVAYSYESHSYERREEEEGEEATTPATEGKLEQDITKVEQLQQLLERFLATRPAGVSKHNRLVLVALYPAVKESFQLYWEITDTLSELIEKFMEVETEEAVKIRDIICRSSKQLDELNSYYTWSKEVGVGRCSEYPQIERIPPKKLQLMDDFIREKSVNPDHNTLPLRNKEEEEEVEVEDDPNTIKALPAPSKEPHVENKQEEKEEEIKQEEPLQPQQLLQQDTDLLNLWDEPITSPLSLLLLDEPGLGPMDPSQPSGSVWDAFKDTNSDWEAELVQSTSYLPRQTTQLGGGLNMMVLDGLYQQGSGYIPSGTGSSSSVALGSAGNPPAQMLALPAPPGSQSEGTREAQFDPFGPSMVVPPPSYVQMSDLEQKQRLMMEEQMMWQQYGVNGMQGHQMRQGQYLGGYNSQMQGCNQFPNGYRYY